jgi:hypothetical protein
MKELQMCTYSWDCNHSCEQYFICTIYMHVQNVCVFYQVFEWYLLRVYRNQT